MIPNDFIAQLLSRVDVVEIIDRHVPLKKKGKDYSACCPFHKEKSPSFSVSQTKQFYYCYGCGASGSAITFLMEYSGKSFPDAVEELAQGIGLTVPNDNTQQADPQAGGLFDMMIAAAGFYKQQLKSSPVAIDYFKKRGVSGEVARRFHLGWAPAGWRPLAEVFDDYADNQLLETAGLITTGEHGTRYDRFRERVIFPILNQQGAVIAFGGRILGSKDDGGGPKYLNSPETPIFSKGRELYGLFQAQAAIRKMNRVLVVEGYMDVVALAQYGVEYVVATLGTATTEAHTQRLLRAADEVVFSFDGDSAGQRAAWRALENALPALRDGKQVRFLFLPTEHDPDSYVREFGREAFEDYVAKALPLSEYWIRELNARHPGSDSGSKAARTSTGQKHLELVGSDNWRKLLAADLAADVGLLAQDILEAVPVRLPETKTPQADARFARAGGRLSPTRGPNPVDGTINLHSQRVIKYPKLASFFAGVSFPNPHLVPRSVQVLSAISNYVCRHGDDINQGALYQNFADSEIASDVIKLLSQVDDAMIDAVPLEDAETQLRALRNDIESGQRFAPSIAVPLPNHASSTMGIVGTLAPTRDRSEDFGNAASAVSSAAANETLPPGGGGAGQRGTVALQKHVEQLAHAREMRSAHPLPNPSPLKGEGQYPPSPDDFDDIPFEANFAPSTPSDDHHEAPF